MSLRAGLTTLTGRGVSGLSLRAGEGGGREGGAGGGGLWAGAGWGAGLGVPWPPEPPSRQCPPSESDSDMRPAARGPGRYPVRSLHPARAPSGPSGGPARLARAPAPAPERARRRKGGGGGVPRDAYEARQPPLLPLRPPTPRAAPRPQGLLN